MKCEKCGWSSPPKAPRGRPKILDEKKVRKMRKAGKSYQEIGDKFGVSRGAVFLMLKRAGS